MILGVERLLDFKLCYWIFLWCHLHYIRKDGACTSPWNNTSIALTVKTAGNAGSLKLRNWTFKQVYKLFSCHPYFVPHPPLWKKKIVLCFPTALMVCCFHGPFIPWSCLQKKGLWKSTFSLTGSVAKLKYGSEYV